MTVRTFIVGDSIAEGVAQVLRPTGSSTKVGISSYEVLKRVPTAFYDVLIVSAGSNDSDNPALFNNLVGIVHSTQSRQIIWILPVNPTARDAVVRVADAFGSATVSFKPGPDNVHPRSYESLAASIKIIMIVR